MKKFIAIVIFSFVASVHAAESALPENNGLSAAIKEEALDQWSNMRQQPDLTEESGTQRGLRLFRKKTTTAEGVQPKTKTAKVKKGADKEESLVGASQSKSAGAGKEKASDVVAQPKSSGALGQESSANVGVKPKSLGAPSKARSPDGTTKTEY